jgi:CheY-like chemotaxis protein
MENIELTILHVEDDPLLAHLVKMAFMRFGFQGEVLTVVSVNEAVRLLGERAENKKPVSLVITDMQLPDGTGLDLIREVKTDPAWRMTPIIVLSHDVGKDIINDAYSLGANSYISKTTAWNVVRGSLENIYRYWLESVRLPQGGPRDRLQETLERAIALRTRTAEFYLRLARAFPRAPEETSFWLSRALNEGNLSNLLAFFRNRVQEKNVAPGTIDRFRGMQTKVKDALKTAEERLMFKPVISPELAYELTLALTDALDEEVFAEVLGILFPTSAVAAMALRARAALQMNELATFIRERTKDEVLRRKADLLLDWSRRLSSDK